MPGTALVTINDNQWSVEVANTTSELIQGLSGVASIPAGTGMLFILPARQLVTVQTEQMLFPIDIIFIKDDAVLSIAPNIQPGYLVEEATPCDGFLEVNANEAFGVEVGDAVTVEVISTPSFDWSSIVSFAIPLALLGFVCAMAGGMMKGISGSSHSSSSPRRLGEPKTEAERKETHYGKYGTKELPERGKGREEYYWEITDIDTGEIIQKGKPYTTISKVYRSVRDYQRHRPGKDKEHLVVIRIFDTPNIDEWGKTIKPVMESGMHRGIPILIGKTPLQEAALDRLWPYKILEIHSDGDLTISSAGKKHVVTTEGGVFGEETHSGKYGTRELPERGKGLESRHAQEGEETRFIGACKIVDGLCHTHGYSVSKTVRCLKSPLADEEWAAAWELAEVAYPEGMSNPWVNGWWPETLEEAEKAAGEYEWKMKDAIRMFREKQAKAMENYERGADKAVYNYRRYVIAEYETGKKIGAVPSPSGHHSMWLTLEQRKELEKKYGMVAVRWAEEATKPGDIKAAERAAEYYYGKVKEALGLGHLSPELSEEQIMKLREVLGLPADVAEILEIHGRTGYVP